jgi:GATA-binding protein
MAGLHRGRGPPPSVDADDAHPEGLLQDSLFPEWRSGAPRPGFDSPDEMQRKDPLATQIWKLYSRTKAQLPNQERMENLTWRMMAMSLKRQEQQRLQQSKYAFDFSRDPALICSPLNFADPVPIPAESLNCAFPTENQIMTTLHIPLPTSTL